MGVHIRDPIPFIIFISLIIGILFGRDRKEESKKYWDVRKDLALPAVINVVIINVVTMIIIIIIIIIILL